MQSSPASGHAPSPALHICTVLSSSSHAAPMLYEVPARAAVTRYTRWQPASHSDQPPAQSTGSVQPHESKV